MQLMVPLFAVADYADAAQGPCEAHVTYIVHYCKAVYRALTVQYVMPESDPVRQQVVGLRCPQITTFAFVTYGRVWECSEVCGWIGSSSRVGYQ